MEEEIKEPIRNFNKTLNQKQTMASLMNWEEPSKSNYQNDKTKINM
jgi:hypothetical protein